MEMGGRKARSRWRSSVISISPIWGTAGPAIAPVRDTGRPRRWSSIARWVSNRAGALSRVSLRPSRNAWRPPMRKLIGGVFQSLDGVMLAPGGPTEDWTQGFTLGGWSATFWDGTMESAMGGLFNAPFDLLLGRKTYEIFAAHWPYVGPDDPIGPVFDRANKYVLTHSGAPLDWVNSHRLGS